MCKRPDTVCKLECIIKFSVVVSYQFGKYFFFENFSSFPLYEDLFFSGTLKIGFFVSPHANQLYSCIKPIFGGYGPKCSWPIRLQDF